MTGRSDALLAVRIRNRREGVISAQDEGPTVAEVYFWDGWQTVEEWTNTGSWGVNKQYVWGEGIDECLKANLPDAADIDADSNTTEKVDLYYHHNSLGSVVAVTNAAGAVKESYRYSAFGKPTIYNASNVEIAATAVKQPFMFTGARYDFEEGSGLYQMRMRYYDPVVGRFVSRDPLGLWGDPSQNGNGQGYCGHNPVNGLDPYGLKSVLSTAWDGLNEALGELGAGKPLDAGKTLLGTGVDVLDGATGGMNPISAGIKGVQNLVGLVDLIGSLASGALDLGDVGFEVISELLGANDALAAEIKWKAGDKIGAILSALDVAEKWVEGGLMICGGLDGLKALRLKFKAKWSNRTQARPPAAPEGKGPSNPGEKAPNSNCFPAGTLVLTSTGRKPIEEIEVGDLVMSRDDQTGETAFKPVTELFRSRTTSLCRLSLRPVQVDGDPSHLGHEREQSTGEQDLEIRCTPGHVVFAWNRGWIHAGDLRPGDHMVGTDGVALCVVMNRLEAESAPTFNFTTVSFHTFFAAGKAGRGVLVHNGPDASAGPTGGASAGGEPPRKPIRAVVDLAGKRVATGGTGEGMHSDLAKTKLGIEPKGGGNDLVGATFDESGNVAHIGLSTANSSPTRAQKEAAKAILEAAGYTVNPDALGP